jgi:hypothetical protein
MTDKETIIAILTKAGVSFNEGHFAVTITSEYSTIFEEKHCVCTLLEFNDVGALTTLRGFRCEDY